MRGCVWVCVWELLAWVAHFNAATFDLRLLLPLRTAEARAYDALVM